MCEGVLICTSTRPPLHCSKWKLTFKVEGLHLPAVFLADYL